MDNGIQWRHTNCLPQQNQFDCLLGDPEYGGYMFLRNVAKLPGYWLRV
jgi:hypothetical protein